MLAVLLLLVLAINGGLYAGTILHSALESSRLSQLAEFYQNFWG